MSTQWMKHALIASVLTVLMILPALAQQRRTAAPRGPAKPAAGTPDSQRLSQILARIEERLTVLENQVISQPPTTNQMSSAPDLATMEARITALENQAISQPPAANQTGSTSGELTCTKLTVVNSAGQPRVMLAADEYMPGGYAYFYGTDGKERALMGVQPPDGGGFILLWNPDLRHLGSSVSMEAHESGGRVITKDTTGQVHTLD